MSPELRAKLTEIWEAAGSPSTRTMSRRLGGIPSHTTIHGALTGRLVPRESKLQSIVEVLGGDWNEVEPLYPVRKIRTVTVRDSSQPDPLVGIWAELRAIRALLEAETEGKSGS